MIEIFRLYLFFGMVLHKLVWEMLKKKDASRQVADSKPQSAFKFLVKSVKVLFLIFLIVQTLFLPVILPISADPLILRWVGLILYTVGLAIAIIGRIELGKNWANIEDYQVLHEQKLVDKGVYRLIRHPIYSGDILLIFGLELALNSWLVLIVVPLAFYVYRQARSEEQILAQAFSGYSTYQNATKMFVPYLF
jgi:protein-S-isoprenylcysteine O-methyltransferase Ste14